MDRVWIYLIEEPRRLRDAGRCLVFGAFALCFAGLLGRLLIASRSLLHQAPESLASLLPQWPTWFIPESWIGFFLAIALGLIGVAAIVQARRIAHLTGITLRD